MLLLLLYFYFYFSLMYQKYHYSEVKSEVRVEVRGLLTARKLYLIFFDTDMHHSHGSMKFATDLTKLVQ